MLSLCLRPPASTSHPNRKTIIYTTLYHKQELFNNEDPERSIHQSSIYYQVKSPCTPLLFKESYEILLNSNYNDNKAIFTDFIWIPVFEPAPNKLFSPLNRTHKTLPVLCVHVSYPRGGPRQREHLSSFLSHPFFSASLSLTHTLSLFSSRLKRLPKDRSKKMNWSQWVSWQQYAVFHKHYLDQQEKKVIIKAYKCSSVTSSKAQLTKFQWDDMPGPKARGS